MSGAVEWRIDGVVGHILLNRPRRGNAVTVGLARELASAVETVAPVVRVIVIRGAGDDFCVGGDVDELAELHRAGREAMRALFVEFGRALRAITSAPVPVVAAVQGNAVAGGFEIMQACDVVVVCADARIADIHSRFGHVPGGGSTQRLPRIVGRQRAMALVLTGDTLSGAEAVAWGLAYRAVEPGELAGAVDALVARLVANPAAAMARSKFLVQSAQAEALDAGLACETEHVLDHLETDGAAAFAAFAQRKGPA